MANRASLDLRPLPLTPGTQEIRHVPTVGSAFVGVSCDAIAFFLANDLEGTLRDEGVSHE